jgi:hypothetical protein
MCPPFWHHRARASIFETGDLLCSGDEHFFMFAETRMKCDRNGPKSENLLFTIEYRIMYLFIMLPMCLAFLLNLIVGYGIDTKKTVNYASSCHVRT